MGVQNLDFILSEDQAEDVLLRNYNISGKAFKIEGEIDLNYRVELDGEPKYLLKISRSEKSADQKHFLVDILNYLVSKNLDLELTEPISGNDDHFITDYSDEYGNLRHVLLLKWVPGRLWCHVNPYTDELRHGLGQASGQLSKALRNFEHPYLQRVFEWDIAQFDWVKDHLDQFQNDERSIIDYFISRFGDRRKVYNNLRKMPIHNDANDHNIIVSEDVFNPWVHSIIDFGDTIQSQLINDVAVTCTYAIMDLPDPLQGAKQIIKGYHQSIALHENELDLLYDCIGIRLVISVTKSALNRAREPENEYLQVSDVQAWALLRKWYDLSPEIATYTFRKACGYDAHPNTARFRQWAESEQLQLNDLFPSSDHNDIHLIDLSVGSLWLGHEEEYKDLNHFQYKIDRLQDEYSDRLIAGGYLEPRSVYTASSYDKIGNSGKQSRTVHLGIDFWLPAHAPVHTLWDGEVVVATNDAGEKEYGGLVILRHDEGGMEFYTLNGHLTVASATANKVGDQLKQGDHIGDLGPFPENGNWVPHLHFQIMLSMLDFVDDFPGVCFYDELEVWSDLCPDPNLVFKIESLLPFKDSNINTLIDFRSSNLGRGLSLHYDDPLHIVKGQDQYLVDHTGRRFLDTVNNVAHVGHENYDVVKAGQEQMALLNTNTRYLHENINKFADQLLGTLPEELCVVHLVNSGSEANELALRMAKTATGGRAVIASEIGYHGNTGNCIDVSSYKFDRKGGTGSPEYTYIFPLPDSFRGKYRGDQTASQYLDEVGKCIDDIKNNDHKLACLILESIISCGGQIELPDGFLAGCYDLIRDAGGLCIADEVQTGCGRVGKTYWAFQLHGVVPDIITIGKPIGNGHPLAAVVCTKAVAQAFSNGMEYFNTFGGNPVSCAIGSAVLNTIDRGNLQENAKLTGDYLKSRLKELATEFPILADVRGQGLFLGFELTDKDLNPLPEQARYLINRMRTLGILTSTDGKDNNVIKIKPPLTFRKEHADHFLEALQKVLNEDAMQL